MKKNKLSLVPFILAACLLSTGCSKLDSVIQNPPDSIKPTEEARAVVQTSINPSKTWNDIFGNAINAHGGSIYYENGFYHWYGEHKVAGTRESGGFTSGGVHCYRSRDLINWNDFGIVLPVVTNNPQSDIQNGCRIERPHVVFNATTEKYICIFKLFLRGEAQNVGYNGVATSSSATGPFVYSHKFKAASATSGSGDFTLFKDVDESLYHITVRKSDRAMVIAKMRNDYLFPSTDYTALTNITISTEAPCVFFKSGTYHLFGSGSSGWNPNPARYFTTNNLFGNWTNQGNPCHGTNPVLNLNETKTFGGQPTDIIQIQGAENKYIAMMDVWRPNDPITSLYIWLPFRVNNKKISVDWLNSWNLSWFN
jgi:Glycosyl hydrolases family 43